VKELLESVRAEFRRLGQPAKAPDMHRVAQKVYPQVKKLPVKDRDSFCEALWQSGKFEEGAVVFYVYRRFSKEFGATHFRLFTRWLDRYVDNWGYTDGLSLWLLGGCILNDESLIAKLDPWTRSRNRWKRRAAAVSLVPAARRGLHTSAIFRIAEPLIHDPDDMVQKGVGWLLKETYPKKPRETVRFLLPWRASAPRLVLQYAAEKMSAGDKEKTLGRK
jgi:3-methyladenine DNA glycosylase AlkD